jgi:hypothetical protein
VKSHCFKGGYFQSHANKVVLVCSLWTENTLSSWYCYQISTLPILSVEDEATLNDDEECAARQIVRHVCVALKRYLEAHLCIKAENLRRTQFRETGGQLEPVLSPAKVSTELLLML